MTTTETTPYRRLETVLGAEEANTLMTHLPPGLRSDVITTADIDRSAALLRDEMSTLETALRDAIDALGSALSGPSSSTCAATCRRSTWDCEA